MMDIGRTLFLFLFFFFNDTATTEIYTLSLHDALPIWNGKTAPSSYLHRQLDITRISFLSKAQECDATMYHMKKASVRELRYDFAKIERMLRHGEEIQITKRRRVIARLI